MKYRFVLFFQMFITALSTHSADWMYHKAVQYKEKHDHSRIYLEDGTKLHVGYTNIKWEEVEKWKKGKLLYIAYMPKTGVVILDPVSRKTIPIINGLKEDPIDIVARRYLNEANNTLTRIDAFRAKEKLWDSELNRVYKAFLADDLYGGRKFTAEQKREIVDAQRKWIQYRDAHLRVIGAHYCKREGSLHRESAAEQCMNFTKNQALWYRNLLGYMPKR